MKKRIVITVLITGLMTAAQAIPISPTVATTTNGGVYLQGEHVGLSYAYDFSPGNYVNMGAGNIQVGIRGNGISQAYVVRYALPTTTETLDSAKLLSSFKSATLPGDATDLTGIDARARIVASDLSDWAQGIQPSASQNDSVDLINSLNGVGGTWIPTGTVVAGSLALGTHTTTDGDLLSFLSGYDFTQPAGNYLEVAFLPDTELTPNANPPTQSNFFTYDTKEENGLSRLELTFVPEPSSVLLIGFALFGLAACRRRQ